MSKPPRSSKRGKRSVEEDLQIMDNMDAWKKQTVNLNFKVNCKFKNKKQKLMYDTILANRITFVHGCAGTGKTLVSLLAGLDILKDKNMNIDQMVLVKPIVEIHAGASIGALPGSVEEKTASYYTHFYDNLAKLVGSETTKFLREQGFIKETVLNFLRGSTFGRYDEKGNSIGSFVIFDETQNSLPVQMKTFISRMGENSKLVIMGDTDQIDLKLKNGEKNGLSDAIERFDGMDGIGMVHFEEDDIVRDPFLIEIMKRYRNA